MCGIVGVIGKKNATEILIKGLEKLEYRGYDSAGIFVSNQKDQKEYLIKSRGKISELRGKIPDEIQGTMGIGHTRWATHGEPSEANAHPHTSENKRLVMVHNGVIENFEEIKQSYLAHDQFIGETDTEIVVHLIEQLRIDNQVSVKEALKEALSIVKGSYALALIEKDQPDVIYVAKNKSPLLIGIGNGFNVICSDAMAMLEQTKEFVEIMDGELVTLTAENIVIEDKEQNKIKRSSYQAQIDVEDIEKGTYPFYMLKEIDEQPAVLRRILAKYTDFDHNLLVDETILQDIQKSDRVYIIACGTSWHAGWVGKNLLEKCAGIPTEVHLASEFGYNMPLLSDRPFFIFISQSGETADSRQVLVQIKEKGFPCLTITNGVGSTLSRESDHTLLLHAGPEIAVASTKAYTAQIAVLALLAKALGEKNQAKEVENLDIVGELSRIANVMETIIDKKEWLASMAEFYLLNERNAFYIGRGLDYYVSMESALKLKEISYIQAEGFAAGELKHGTIALIEEGTPVFGLISDKVMGAHTRGNLKEVESRGAKTFVISTESASKETDQLIIPDIHPLLSPLVTVIPTQLIAYYASLQRGYDVDKPRNLAKSVTVE